MELFFLRADSLVDLGPCHPYELIGSIFLQDAPACVDAIQHDENSTSMPVRCATYLAPRIIDLLCIAGHCIVK